MSSDETSSAERGIREDVRRLLSNYDQRMNNKHFFYLGFQTNRLFLNDQNMRYLISFIQGNPEITTLSVDFNNVALDEDGGAMSVFVDFLRRTKQIFYIVVQCGRNDEDVLLECVSLGLRGNTSIKYVEFLNSDFTSAENRHRMECLLLHKTDLETISFMHCTFDTEANNPVAPFLTKGLAVQENLKTFSISGVTIVLSTSQFAEIINALANNKNLHHLRMLNLNSCVLQSASLEALNSLLMKPECRLSELVFREVQPSFVGQLAASMRRNGTLRSVLLAMRPWADNPPRCIARIIQRNKVIWQVRATLAKSKSLGLWAKAFGKLATMGDNGFSPLFAGLAGLAPKIAEQNPPLRKRSGGSGGS